MTLREFLLSLSLWLKLLMLLGLGGCAAGVQKHDVNVMWKDEAPAKVEQTFPAVIHSEEPTPAFRIEGPAEAAVGELIELVARGDSQGWAWHSYGGHRFATADGNSRLFFSTAKPGSYEFALGAFDGKAPVIVSHHLVVRGSDPVPPLPPGPIPPDPPGPLPPQPVKPLDALVREWAAKVNRPAEASKLAAVYDGVAWKINHGLSEPAQILAMTKEESRKALGVNASFWGEWAENLRQELNARAKAGPLDYASLWREVAAGLLPAGVKR